MVFNVSITKHTSYLVSQNSSWTPVFLNYHHPLIHLFELYWKRYSTWQILELIFQTIKQNEMVKKTIMEIIEQLFFQSFIVWMSELNFDGGGEKISIKGIKIKWEMIDYCRGISYCGEVSPTTRAFLQNTINLSNTYLHFKFRKLNSNASTTYQNLVLRSNEEVNTSRQE